MIPGSILNYRILNKMDLNKSIIRIENIYENILGKQNAITEFLI